MFRTKRSLPTETSPFEVPWMFGPPPDRPPPPPTCTLILADFSSCSSSCLNRDTHLRYGLSSASTTTAIPPIGADPLNWDIVFSFSSSPRSRRRAEQAEH